MRQYWKGFLRWFRSKWDYVEEEVEQVLDEFEPVLKGILAAGGQAFLSIVRNAVSAAAGSGLPNADKFIFAKKQIQRDLRVAGKDISENIINAAIEMVYGRFKDGNP